MNRKRANESQEKYIEAIYQTISLPVPVWTSWSNKNNIKHSVREKKNVFKCFDFACVLRTKWGKSTKTHLSMSYSPHVFTKNEFRIFTNLNKFCLFIFNVFFSHNYLIHLNFFENLELVFRENMWWGVHKAIHIVRKWKGMTKNRASSTYQEC